MVRIARLLVLALLVIVASRPALGQSKAEEYWFVVEMQGQRCGHMHAQTVREGTRFITTGDMRLEMGRAESLVTVSTATEFVETDEGKPVRMKLSTKYSAMTSIKEYVFKPDGVDVTFIDAGVRRAERKPLPQGEWLTPMALERAIAARIAGGVKMGDEIAIRSIEPEAGLTPGTTTMKLLEKTTLDVVGKTVPALKWSSKRDLMPNAPSIDFTDDKGRPLRTEMDMGGIKIVLLRADRALALSKANPPELLESTYIKADKQIKNARTSTHAVFVARADGVPIGEWPAAGAQTVSRIDEHSLRLNIDVGGGGAAGQSVATKAEIDASDFRKPSSMVNSEDAEVLRIEHDALKGHDKDGKDAQAEALRQFVHRFITKKNFDVGFASAAETARTRCGDCTEHAVLLCAMLRADGIPARCVSGLVYADGIAKDGSGAMGYHMWTQAMLESDGKMRWVDLDAALSEKRPMDATHLAIRTLGLADGQTMNDLMDILPTLGKLKITVEKVE